MVTKLKSFKSKSRSTDVSPERFREVIAQWSEVDRRIFRHHSDHGLTYGQIALLLEIPELEALTCLTRAYCALRREMYPEESPEAAESGPLEISQSSLASMK